MIVLFKIILHDEEGMDIVHTAHSSSKSSNGHFSHHSFIKSANKLLLKSQNSFINMIYQHTEMQRLVSGYGINSSPQRDSQYAR